MTIKELRSRMINRSRDGLANYSVIAKNSVSIIDLYDIQKYFIFENILESLLNKRKVELKINYKQVSDAEQNLSVDHELKLEYEKNKESSKENLDFTEWLLVKQVGIKDKIEKLNKKHQELERETGINCLRIGLFYLEGKFSSDLGDEVFRSPMFFMKIRIEITQSQIFLVIDKTDGFFELNDVFFERLSFVKAQKLDYSLNKKINSLFKYNEAPLKILEKAIFLIKENIFKKFNIGLNRDKFFTYDEIKKFNKATVKKQELVKNIKEYNFFIFFNYATIGIFKTTSFEIISDLEKWENQNGDNFLRQMDRLINDNYFEDIAIKEDFEEKDITQISNLDFSQKVAILKSLKQNTVIKGPPGTGKSQTIVNLIINILNNNKNLIFSAEKKVATEVVYNNLSTFKNFSLKIYDLNKDKRNFYKQLNDNWNFIIRNQIFNFSNYIDDANNQIASAFNQIKKYKKFLNYPEYKVYLNCLKEFSMPNLIIDNFLSQAFNLNFFSRFNILEKDIIDELIIELKWKKKMLDFYNRVVEFPFIFDNFNYLDEILTFNWRDINNKKSKKVFVDFCKSKNLKQIAKKIKKRSNYDFDKSLNYLKRLTKAEIEKWFELKENFNELSELQIIFNHVKNDEEIISLVKKLYIEEFEKKYQEIIEVEKTDWHQVIKDNFDAKIKYTKLELKNKIANNISKKLDNYCSIGFENRKKLQKFVKIITENKKFPSIKWFIENFGQIIFIMTPIFITSIDVVPSIIPLKRGFFDFTIFDEASQIYLEKSIAILYRGKKNIIVGDPQQLAPTNYFLRNIELDNQDEDIENSLTDKVEEFSSLLEYVSYKFQCVGLKYHYRSLYRELIEFSNHYFYQSNLIFVDHNDTKKTIKPIKEIFVRGIWDNQVNEIEAKEVLNLIEKIVATKKETESIGVITFNKKQAELIKEKLDKSVNSFIENELNNRSEKDFLFVKNLEEVQGDERDIIILAISFACNPDGKFYRNFGPINKTGGENRINVAITRAKKQIYVVKSINSKEILSNSEREISNGAVILGKYLEYVEKIQNHALSSNKIKSLFLGSDFIEDSLEDKTESILETEIYNKLVVAFKGTNYEIKQQVEQSGYTIDLAIWDNINYKYLLAIECGANAYHSKLSDKERDWYRQNFLENKGWTFYQINSHDWWKITNQDKIISSVKEKIQKIINPHVENRKIENLLEN
ncbi:MAG: AAA domain-containing protein [Spiroplasma sp.]